MLHYAQNCKYTTPQPVQMPTEVNVERCNFYILVRLLEAVTADQKRRFGSYITKPCFVPVLCFILYKSGRVNYMM